MKIEDGYSPEFLGGGEISYTTDGGKTWTKQVTDVSITLNAMDFYSSEHGICVGGKSGNFAIYYTTDGIIWTKAPTPTGLPSNLFRTDLFAVTMINDSVSVITGWGGSGKSNIILRTIDGGKNWTYQTQVEENRMYLSLYGIAFKDENNGIAVGGNSYKGGVAYKTNDGGISWKEISFPFGFQGSAISYINNKVCIVGSTGGIAISEDDCETWKLITEIPLAALYKIKKIGDNTIVAAGYNGLFLKSVDNGKTWESSYVSDQNVSATIEDIFFLDENIGFVAQKYRTVSKTIDGGKNWLQIMKDTTSTVVNNYGIQFINEDVGFVVGKVATNISAFYKTTDGGKNWTSQIGNPIFKNILNDLHFFNENYGIVVGNNTTLAYTSDGGNSWSQIPITSFPDESYKFSDIEFFDDNFGLIGGHRLIKSTNGGKLWKYFEVPGLPGFIRKIEIIDELTWYLAGSKFLFKTIDGGVTWSNLVDSVYFEGKLIFDVAIDSSGYPWVACESSEIFTISPTVSVEIFDDTIVNNFSLEANYPNPFNPTTKIRYSIPTVNSRNSDVTFDGANVTLKIYNILGEEIATLVNNGQKGGTYEVEFDATHCASGMYIYTLNISEFSKSKKMLLIR